MFFLVLRTTLWNHQQQIWVMLSEIKTITFCLIVWFDHIQHAATAIIKLTLWTSWRYLIGSKIRQGGILYGSMCEVSRIAFGLTIFSSNSNQASRNSPVPSGRSGWFRPSSTGNLPPPLRAHLNVLQHNMCCDTNEKGARVL